jgi:hypothetical protein
MKLEEFFEQTRSEVAEQIAGGATYAELIFAEIVMQHLAETGMSFEPEVCHYEAKIANSRLRLTGYAFSEENDQLDLFVSLYSGVERITPVSDSDTKKAAEQCLRFLTECAFPGTYYPDNL